MVKLAGYMVCVLLLLTIEKQLLGHHDELLSSGFALLFRGRLLSCFTALAHQGTDINGLLLIIIIVIIIGSVHNIEIRQLFIVFILVKSSLCILLVSAEECADM